MNLNWIFSYEIISEQFNDGSSINNMEFNIYIFYTSVRFNSVSISNIESFEHFMNLNSIFSYETISEQFNDISSINNMAFNLFIK